MRYACLFRIKPELKAEYKKPTTRSGRRPGQEVNGR
jgi:hypothetical protein